jgi:UDP-N-acetylglucosamine/UDP-N-acetylgalactosamine diphosphorylase
MDVVNYDVAMERKQAIDTAYQLNNFDCFDPEEKKQLLEQLAKIDIDTLVEQKKLLESPAQQLNEEWDSFLDYASVDSIADEEAGKKLIAEGRVGCLIVAGGQGSRLRFEGPKGMFPTSIIKQKSLFQIFAEKVLAAGKQAKRLLFLAIMTSPANHEETVKFFSDNQLFGLSSEQLSFFQQKELPLLTQEGNIFLESRSKISTGPDGNGGVFEQFVESGIWSKWQQSGVRYVNFILIDNPLADPFDAKLIAFHAARGLDVSIKCVPRKDPEEKVGIIVRKGNKVQVVEYSELSARERFAAKPSGDLKHVCANLSLFCFSMEFVKKSTEQRIPLHLALKSAKVLCADGVSRQSEKPQFWKFEKFIFDLLPMADKVGALLYAREDCFAPLKNFDGQDSLKTVQAALQEADRKAYQKVSGIAVSSDAPFELSQEFYYPTSEMLADWQGKSLPTQAYIDAGMNGDNRL